VTDAGGVVYVEGIDECALVQGVEDSVFVELPARVVGVTAKVDFIEVTCYDVVMILRALGLVVRCHVADGLGGVAGGQGA
jgi:hypothetical protein